MKNEKRYHYFHSVFTAVLYIVAGLLLATCVEKPQAQDTFTIGIVTYAKQLNPVIDGLKAGIADLGYAEDKDVTYVYNGAVKPEEVDQEVQNLLEQDVDLLFTLGTEPTLSAKRAVEGTDIPVVFAPVVKPVEEGIVESISHPGGNVTGIQTGNTLPKAVEWLLTLAPAAQIYTFYHPEDAVSLTSIAALRETAYLLEVEVIADETRTPEEVIAALEALPEDTVVFTVPFPSLEPGLDAYATTALEHDIAVGTYQADYMRDGILVSLSVDLFDIGHQAAHLVDQAHRGIAPADLPVETADGFLTINLVTAEAIGLDISDDLLEVADIIIR